MTDTELDALTPARLEPEAHVPAGAVKLLDHGFIRLVRANAAPGPLDGDPEGASDADHFIAWCARRSYQDGTEHHRTIGGLLRYLLKHGHMSPFEHVAVTFHAFVPLFVQNQWVRHRTGKFSILSLRYSLVGDFFHVPGTLRLQDAKNRQGSDGQLAPTVAGPLLCEIEESHRMAIDTYERLIAAGVSREQARGVIPVNVYSDMVFTCDLRNALHFVGLRYEAHAQPEIQVYGREVLRALEGIAPLTCRAWAAMNGRSLSGGRPC